MYTMIGTVMTRCVMTSAVSVLLRRRELEDGEQGDQVGQRRRHSGDEDQDREFLRIGARDAVARRHADQQRDQRRSPETTMLFHR